MIQQIFSVYDSKAAAYLTPFFSISKGVALRSFMAAANDASHDFSKYPNDFSLFHIGQFDQETCKFDLHAAPENLGTALQMKEDQ